MMMNDSVLARVAALKKMPTAELKQQWQQLFEAQAPPYHRRFLESRLGLPTIGGPETMLVPSAR